MNDSNDNDTTGACATHVTTSEAQAVTYSCPLLAHQPLRLLSHLCVFDTAVTHACNKSNMSQSHSRSMSNGSFVKSVECSPDGTQLLFTTEDGFASTAAVHPVETVQQCRYYQPVTPVSQSQIREKGDINSMTAVREIQSENENVRESENIRESENVRESESVVCCTRGIDINVGESILDAKWYPFADASSNCCFATTSRDHPIHLWDAATGALRCSYTGFNRFDELDSAHCLAFNPSGDRVYAGSDRMVRSFELSRPGKNFTDAPTCKTRKDFMGQRGIISCISFCPDYSRVFAAGSFAHSVAIYSEDTAGSAMEIRDAAVGGVTCVKWSTCGRYLWIGGRNKNASNDSPIVCWDVRKAHREVGRVSRGTLGTNQRMRFDLDPWGENLFAGSQDGELLVYNTKTFALVNRQSLPMTHNSSSEGSVLRDCVNSVVCHPFSSLLITATGQRHFDEGHSSGSDSDDSSSDMRDLVDGPASASATLRRKSWSSGIQLWKIQSNVLQMPSQQESEHAIVCEMES